MHFIGFMAPCAPSFLPVTGSFSCRRVLETQHERRERLGFQQRMVTRIMRMQQLERGAVEGSGPTYADSGVDIDREGASVASLIRSLGAPGRKAPSLGSAVDHPGGFSGLIDFGPSTLLALCTDGVGSKLMLASELRRFDTVGFDCVAMNVNDLICVGAEPIAFVDYIAAPSPDPQTWSELGTGLGAACRIARVTLSGGETASLPDMVKEVDMSGTALGWVSRGAQLDGGMVAPGDALIGLPSSGLHSNGFSLVRRIIAKCGADLNTKAPFDADAVATRAVLQPDGGEKTFPLQTLGDVLLYPTMIYVDPVVDLLVACREQSEGAPCQYQSIHGMAHITGGGLCNLLRLRPGMGYDIDQPLAVLPEFQWLGRAGGNVSAQEMYRVFNMGMGMVLVVDETVATDVCEWLAKRLPGTQIIGRVTSSGEVRHRVTEVAYDRYG